MRGPAAASVAISARGTNRRRLRASGRNSATGVPLRVTTKLAPASTAASICAFWLRKSRCAMTRLISESVANSATQRYAAQRCLGRGGTDALDGEYALGKNPWLRFLLREQWLFRGGEDEEESRH